MSQAARIGTGLDRLREIVGRERALSAVSQALHFAVVDLEAPVVGAMLVTCADESERECADAFHNGFVRYVVPNLKTGQRGAFRLANLGGQYEWGSIRIAEDHFAGAGAPGEEMLLAVKVNAHVGVQKTGDGPTYGTIRRYETQSACCGALASLLGDGHLPFVERLREAFLSEGVDRVAALRDESVIEPPLRALAAAIVSVRLQARKTVLDIQDHVPAARTRYLVLPSVTLNRPERDTEIVVGIYTAEHDETTCHAADYYGLADDPSAYEIEHGVHGATVTDPHLGQDRRARNHRELARAARSRVPSATRIPADQLAEIHGRVPPDGSGKRHAKALLRALLPLISGLAPASAALLLFGHGLAGVHHVFRIHRIMKDVEGSAEGRRVLDEIHGKIDRLEPDKAEAMLQLLLAEYGS